MLLFIAGLVIAFRMVAKALRLSKGAQFQEQFLIWSLGCILFGHVTAMVSVSYFDQSVFYLYLVLAAIAAVQAVPVPAAKEDFQCETVVAVPSAHEANLCHHR